MTDFRFPVQSDQALPPEWYRAIDLPDERDYPYELAFGATAGTAPLDHIPFPAIPVQDQSKSPATRMACGQFALCHIVNAQNRIRSAADRSAVRDLDAAAEWARLVRAVPSRSGEGSSLQDNLKDAVARGTVTGYAVVSKKEEIMHALAHQRYVYTGSASGDWAAVRDTKRYRIRRDAKFVGHIVAVGSYTAEGVLAINSYGPRNGIFFIDWDTFLGHFYTKYAVVDSRDEPAFARYRASFPKIAV